MPALRCSTALYCRKAWDNQGSWGKGVPCSCLVCAWTSTERPQRTACSGNDGHSMVWGHIMACHRLLIFPRAAWQPTKAWRLWDWSERPLSLPPCHEDTFANVLARHVGKSCLALGKEKVFMPCLNTLWVLSVVCIFPPFQWQAQ